MTTLGGGGVGVVLKHSWCGYFIYRNTTNSINVYKFCFVKLSLAVATCICSILRTEDFFYSSNLVIYEFDHLVDMLRNPIGFIILDIHLIGQEFIVCMHTANKENLCFIASIEFVIVASLTRGTRATSPT